MSLKHQQMGICSAALAMMMLALTGCSHSAAQTVEQPPAVIIEGTARRIPPSSPYRSRLVVQTVKTGAMTHDLLTPGVVEADPARTIPIVPPLTGKIVELKVGLGDAVHRGQILLVIASGDLAQAYADADKARDALDLARKALDRATGVREAGGQAVKDLEAAQSGYTQALAEFERADTRLNSLGGSAERHGAARRMSVTAPANGTITSLAVAVGAYVNDTTSAAMTVSNLDPIWVTANLPENEVDFITRGQQVDVALAAYPGESWKGSVAFVDAVLDSSTRRDRVRIAFANPEAKLKPNMYATVTFHLPQPARVLVPQSALLMNNDSTTVFVESSPWVFERRTVELGYDEGDYARVLSGVEPGERVIVSGGVLLND